MANVMTEQEIVKDSYNRLRNSTSLSSCCEVPMLGRSVDLVYIEGTFLVSIEFKLKNWRKALEQAYDHKLGADYAYICMPQRKVSEAMCSEFLDAGVGLVFYKEEGEWPFECAIEAPKSDEVWSSAKLKASRYVLKYSNEEL